MKAQEDLIYSCQGLVRTLAWQIRCKLPKHMDLDDLVGYGQIGLAQAARDFRPEAGAKFTTFAYYRIRGAILDGLSKMNWFSQVKYYRGDYRRASEHDQEDSRLVAPRSPKLQDQEAESKNEGIKAALVIVLGDRGHGAIGSQEMEDNDAESPLDCVMQDEIRKRLHELIDALPIKGSELIRAAYFQGMSLKDAGEKLGISRAWASRLHARTLKQLAQMMEDEGLGE